MQSNYEQQRDQQLAAAINSTLVVQNRESVEKFCVPELRKIIDADLSLLHSQNEALTQGVLDRNIEHAKEVKELEKEIEWLNEINAELVKRNSVIGEHIYDKSPIYSERQVEKMLSSAWDGGYALCRWLNSKLAHNLPEPADKQTTLNNILNKQP